MTMPPEIRLPTDRGFVVVRETDNGTKKIIVCGSVGARGAGGAGR
jgi:hypothetical protein